MMRLLVVSNKRYNLDQNYTHYVYMHGKYHGYRQWVGIRNEILHHLDNNQHKDNV